MSAPWEDYNTTAINEQKPWEDFAPDVPRGTSPLGIGGAEAQAVPTDEHPISTGYTSAPLATQWNNVFPSDDWQIIREKAINAHIMADKTSVLPSIAYNNYDDFKKEFDSRGIPLTLKAESDSEQKVKGLARNITEHIAGGIEAPLTVASSLAGGMVEFLNPLPGLSGISSAIANNSFDAGADTIKQFQAALHPYLIYQPATQEGKKAQEYLAKTFDFLISTPSKATGEVYQDITKPVLGTTGSAIVGGTVNAGLELLGYVVLFGGLGEIGAKIKGGKDLNFQEMYQVEKKMVNVADDVKKAEEQSNTSAKPSVESTPAKESTIPQAMSEAVGKPDQVAVLEKGGITDPQAQMEAIVKDAVTQKLDGAQAIRANGSPKLQPHADRMEADALKNAEVIKGTDGPEVASIVDKALEQTNLPQTETATQSLITPTDAVKAAVDATPAKSTFKVQKKYLISEVDELIKTAPQKTNTKTITTSKSAPDSLTQVDFGKTKMVTIDVPGDGVFKIINSKEALTAFKDAIEKNFPTDAVKKNTTAKISGTSNARPDVRYNLNTSNTNKYESVKEYQPRTIIDASYGAKDTLLVGDDWFSNGHYAIKGDAPAKLKVTGELSAKMREAVIPKEGLERAEIVHEYHAEGQPFHEVFISNGSSEAGYMAQYVDIIKKRYPDAVPYIEGKAAFPKTVWKVGRETIAVLMPVHNTPETLSRIKGLWEEGGKSAGVTLGSGLGGLQDTYETLANAAKENIPELAKGTATAVSEPIKDVSQGLKTLLAPTTKSPEHVRAAEIASQHLIGEVERNVQGVKYRFAEAKTYFDKLLGKGEEGKRESVAFMEALDKGTLTDNPYAKQVKELLEENKKQIGEVSPEKMQWLKEDYFPRLVEQKDVPAAIEYLSRRPLGGKKGFLKQRVFDDIMELEAAGFKLKSYNPIDLLEESNLSVQRYVSWQKALKEYNANGDIKFINLGEKVPDGFAKLDDKFGTVYAPPTLIAKEYVDRAVYDGLLKVADKLGVDHKRAGSAGRGKLGYSIQGGDKIVTQYATELSVLAHEIGHQIDYKYNLWDKIIGKDIKPQGKDIRNAELRAMADLKFEGSESSAYYKAKIRKTPEKMARLLEAYIHAPEKFKEVAPTIFETFDKFIRDTPELKDLADIKPSISLKELQTEKRLSGLPLIGYRVAKKPTAEILNNYLSKSIYSNEHFGTLYKGYMAVANTLNQAQLGIGSAFHAGFTTSETIFSGMANNMKDIYRLATGKGNFTDTVKGIVDTVKAPVANPLEGGKILKEYLAHGSTNNPAIQTVAKAVEIAGGRAYMEAPLQTHQYEAMMKDWYSGNKLKAALRSPVAFTELSAKPILHWLVPRQKLVVFGELVSRIVKNNPGKSLEELRPELRQAWNRVDSRLGQVVNERLFVDNAAKNVIQGLVRAPGWTGGTIVEIGGSLKDTASFIKEWKKTGKLPAELPDRVAYTLSLLIGTAVANGALTYAFTGEMPQGIDYWAFRTGDTDEKGRPQRFLLPTYAKDIFSYANNPGSTLIAKSHPVLGMISNVIRNKDYYGVEIRHPGDNPIQQASDLTKFGIKQYEPFWIRGAGKITEAGGGVMKTLTEHPGKLLAPEIGIMPASSEYTNTAAEKVMSEIYQRRPLSTKTKAEFEKQTAIRSFKKRIKEHDPELSRDMAQAIVDGVITQKDRQHILESRRETLLQSGIKHLTAEQAMEVFDVANEDEKRQIRLQTRKKIWDSDSLSLSQKTGLTRRLNQ